MPGCRLDDAPRRRGVNRVLPTNEPLPAGPFPAAGGSASPA